MPSRTYRIALVLILFTGVVLRTIQYGPSTSMWYDELSIALNVLDRSLRELLFQPLQHYQVAPIGFLFLEKVGVALLGDSEAGFRLFPFLFSLLSLVLFWRVSVRYLGDHSRLAALIVYAMSPTLVFYAGTVKQYSGDIAVTLFLLWTTLRFFENPVTLPRAAAMGVIGGLGLLLSQPAVLVASGLGLVLLVEGHRGAKPHRQVLAICAGWFVGAAIQTYTSLTNLSAATRAVMQGFWVYDFVPPPWTGWRELVWVPARLAEFLGFFVVEVSTTNSLPEIAFASTYGILSTLGIVYLLRKDLRTAAILLVPVAVAVAAACIRLLPLTHRISLFMGPSLLIACFAAFDLFRVWLPSRGAFVAYSVAYGLAILPALGVLVITPPPQKLSESRRVLREVSANRLPGDKLVVVRWWGWMSTEYYGPRVGLEGWTHIAPLEGGVSIEEILRGYLRGIDDFRGEPRVWFFLDGTRACEDAAILGYLTAIGRRIQVVQATLSDRKSVSAHLYDLTDPALLELADAKTFPVPSVCPES